MSVLDTASQSIVDDLHAQARAQMRSLVWHYLPRLPRLLSGRPLGAWADTRFYRDKLLPLEPAQGELLYLLARGRRVRRAVEFGTSFGVSTIYLAAAIRDGGSGGTLIGTELEPGKVAAARANLARAGLASHVQIREGDALRTLRDLDEPVDLLLLDGWPALAHDVLRLVEPHLARDAIVVVDNVAQFPGDLRPTIEHLTQSGRYRTSRVPLRGGTMVSVYRGEGGVG
jgi:predicted O-methyltransferase YrrM